jgi:hypothetical protein
MSLVGPRPEDPRYIALYTPLQRQVLNVRPGVTSPASLDYQDEETLLDGENWETTYCNEILPRKLAIDLAYLRQRSLWTDLGVIAQTATTIINGGQRFNSILELRNRHFLIIDIFFLTMIPAIAFTLRLDGLGWWMRASEAVLLFTLVSLLVKIPIFHRLGLYDRYWRYASINDLLVILIAVGLSTTVLAIGYAGAHPLLWRYDLGIPGFALASGYARVHDVEGCIVSAVRLQRSIGWGGVSTRFDHSGRPSRATYTTASWGRVATT